MQLTFSNHAAKQMEERHISREATEAVLMNPERTEVKAFEIVYDGVVAARRLRVVVARDTDPSHIVTAYPRRR